MITSKHTGRWILPKGWPMAGYGAAGVAVQEAWEEAGVGSITGAATKVGRYHYTKRLRGGVPAATVVDVYAAEVAQLADDYPEAARRVREWMSPEDAAASVEEPELQSILQDFPAILAAGLPENGPANDREPDQGRPL